MDQTEQKQAGSSKNGNSANENGQQQKQHSVSDTNQCNRNNLTDNNNHNTTAYHQHNSTNDHSSSSDNKNQQLMRNSNETTVATISDSDAEISDPSGKQHHVGAVMGIFFKVWSLVKVTKGRHMEQKMRRQNSEDAGQHHFQYISGSELQQQQQQQLAQLPPQTSILQDRHFRRAGSQPASNTSGHSTDYNQHKTHQSQHEAAANRLQVNLAGAMGVSTGTSSTSSGVSSTSGSSQLNFNNQSPPIATTGGSPTGSGGSVRRHLSAYSLRRSTAEVATVQQQHAQRAAGGGSPTQHKHNNNNQQQEAGKQSWASKIKRSATTVNQTDFSSYVSKYRFRRDNNQQQQQSKKSSSKQNQKQPVTGRMDTSASSASLFAATQANRLANAQQKQLQQQQLQMDSKRQEEPSDELEVGADEDEDGDADSNDIYSTPNDSIQSVPSQAPFIFANEPRLQAQWSTGATSQQSAGSSESRPNVVRSSSSTGSFAQLLKQQQSTTSSATSSQRQQPQRFAPIGELAAAQDRCTGMANNNNPRASNVGVRHQDSSNSRRTNGSHFFISSSSSEDSNSANQQPSAQPTMDQRRVTLQQGVHYHSPSSPQHAARPNSLLLMEESYAIPSIQQPTAPITPGLQHPMSPLDRLLTPPATYLRQAAGYRKSPSLHEIMAKGYPGGRSSGAKLAASCWTQHEAPVAPRGGAQTRGAATGQIPNSISLHDGFAAHRGCWPVKPPAPGQQQQMERERVIRDQSEYRLAQMLLERGGSSAKDQDGYTALMHAVLSDNLAATRCLLEHQVDPNETNPFGQSALDLLCSRAPTRERLDIFKLLVESGANLDRTSELDNTRLIDRLIGQHGQCSTQWPPSDGCYVAGGEVADDKLPYIDCLLQNGAKLGSSTWAAASGKREIQLRLLRKLCQDGYFLYKTSCIEAAVYRFEYALKRIAELEQQLMISSNEIARRRPLSSALFAQPPSQQHLVSIPLAHARQLKYQTYLGLSRCERKRKFYKRALEFAHLAILVESSSYEGYYSKAHILKDLGEWDDALRAIEQTEHLVESSIERLELELRELGRQEAEEMVLDGRLASIFDMTDNERLDNHEALRLMDAERAELSGTVEYLREARRFVSKLKVEIMDDKQRQRRHSASADDGQQPVPSTTHLPVHNGQVAAAGSQIAIR